MLNEQLAGGLRCSEVLALLSDFSDGELAASVVQQIEAHVAECTNCLRFGESFQEMLAAMKAAPIAVEPSPAVLRRLSEKLDAALAGD